MVKIAQTEFQMNGPHLGELREANDLLDSPEALRERMLEDGYLLMRGLQDRETVLNARGAILEHLSAAGTLDPNSDPMEAVIAPDKGPRGGFRGGVDELANSPSISAVARSPEIMGFFEKFLGGPVLTLDHRWLRIVGSGGFTGCHYDVVYMGRGTKNLYTSWCPIGDVTLELGGLAVCVGSHRWDEVKESYGRMDVDRDRADGEFTNDPMELVEKFGGQWGTTAFSAGDVVIFSMFTMHASISNQTNRFRLSMDTRYQLAAEEHDERWVGEGHIGHGGRRPGRGKSIEEARREWGV